MMRYIYNINEAIDIMTQGDNKLNQVKFKTISRIVVISNVFYDSLRMLKANKLKIQFADPSKAVFEVKEKIASITTYEDECPIIRFNANDAGGKTLVLLKHGYKDPEIAGFVEFLRSIGVIVLNPIESVNISSNKYLTAIELQKHGIPQPKFILSSANDIHKGDHSKLDSKLKKIYKDADDSSDYVCKVLDGHGGFGVFKCTGKNIVSILQCIYKLDKNEAIMVQEYKHADSGDIRANVLNINGTIKIVDVALRKKVGKDFRSNLSLGAKMQEDFKLTPQQEVLVKEAAKQSGLLWSGIDLMHTKEGEDIIIEVNGVPGPSTDDNDPDIKDKNYAFYVKILKNIDDIL